MRNALDVICNFHWVLPGEMARAAQPLGPMLPALLKRHKIGSLINLRGPNPQFGWWNAETRSCKAMGIAHFDTMLDSRKLPLRAMLVTLFEAFEAAPRPFLIKCSGGQDRTSLAAALYLVHRGGWSARAVAQKQFSRWPYLHFPKTHQRWLRVFLGYAQSEAQGAPLAGWVRESYDPAHFARWLDANGYAGTYKEIFVKAEASRWQW